MEMDSADIETLRNEHESTSEWEKRRSFLETHKDKFELDRLVCLSNCYINVEIYGSRYPAQVMSQLKELCAQLPTPPTPPMRKRGVKIMNFVQASTSTGAWSIEFKDSQKSHSKCEHQSPVPAEYQFRNDPKRQQQQNFSNRGLTGMNFVKADSEYVSTDIAFQQSHSFQNIPFASSSRKKGFGSEGSNKLFKQSYRSDHTSADPYFDGRFMKLTDSVESCRSPEKNAVEVIHTAASKCQMQVVDTYESYQTGKCEMEFVCSVEIDGVHVTKSAGTNKKKAKHSAFTAALDLLTDHSARVIEQSRGLFAFVPNQSAVPMPSNYSSGNVRGPAQLKRKGPSSSRTAPKKTKTECTNSAYLEDFSQFVVVEYSKPVLLGSCALSVVYNCASFNKVSVEFDFEILPLGHQCHVFMGGLFVATATGDDEKESKRNASEMAVSELKRNCYTLKITSSVDKENSTELTKDALLEQIGQGKTEQLPDSNIGHMLLKKMGWAGGGVGKDGTGIAEPVKAENVIGRSGLGFAAASGIPADFRTRIQTILVEYANSDNPHDIYFSSEFSKEERAMIHEVGGRYNLRTASHGRGGKRFLVISRKRNPHQLINHVLQCGGTTGKYQVIPPDQDDAKQ